MTGGWPKLVEQVIGEVHKRERHFDDIVADLSAHLATPEGARGLMGDIGLDSQDPDQPADPGVLAVFNYLLADNSRVELVELADYLELLAESEAIDDPDPREALDILRLMAVIDEDEDGCCFIEPVLGTCATLAGTTAVGI